MVTQGTAIAPVFRTRSTRQVQAQAAVLRTLRRESQCWVRRPKEGYDRSAQGCSQMHRGRVIGDHNGGARDRRCRLSERENSAEIDGPAGSAAWLIREDAVPRFPDEDHRHSGAQGHSQLPVIRPALGRAGRTRRQHCVGRCYPSKLKPAGRSGSVAGCEPDSQGGGPISVHQRGESRAFVAPASRTGGGIEATSWGVVEPDTDRNTGQECQESSAEGPMRYISDIVAAPAEPRSGADQPAQSPISFSLVEDQRSFDEG